MDPLVTAAELQLTMQRTLDPDAAALAIASASGLVRDYCRWSISAEAVTFEVDGSGTTLLSLPTLHVISVAQVRLNGEILEPAGAMWGTAHQYTWSKRGQLYRGAGWPDVMRSVQVDCVHGYTEIPDAVRAVVLSLAGAAAFNPGGALQSKTVGSVTHTYRDAPGALTELQAFQLSGYRLP